MSPQEKKVIIIGAGASGIGAARTFIQSGVHPIILEARDRIGGRMCSKSLIQNLIEDDKKTDSKITVQLGANWIHCLDETNPFFAVAKKLNLHLHMTSSDDEPGNDVILFDEGEEGVSECKGSPKPAFCRITQLEYKEALDRYEWIRDHFERLVTPNKHLTLKDCLELVLKASEEFFGPCSDCHRRCFNWFFDRVSIDLAAPLEYAATDSYLEVETDGFAGEALVSGGYFQVLEHLAQEFPLDVRLNKVVTSIQYMSSDNPMEKPVGVDGQWLQGVRIECADGEVFFADACLVTLPIGVLQTSAVQFIPAVPKQIASLCSLVKAGLMNIVWLWYPHKFWPDDCNFLGVAHKESAPVQFGTFLVPPMYDQHGQKQAVLMCQVVGVFAEQIEFMSEREVAAAATQVLRNMFDGTAGDGEGHAGGQGENTVPDAIGCMRSTWKSDPYSRGSWTHIPYKGAAGAQQQLQEQPEAPLPPAVVDSCCSSLNSVGEFFPLEVIMSTPPTPPQQYPQKDDLSADKHSAPLTSLSSGIDQVVFYSGEASNAEHRGTAHSAYMSGIEEAQKMLFYLCLVTR